MSRNLAFVINPKAGAKKKLDVPSFIQEKISRDVNYEILMWDRVDAFAEIEKKVLNNKYDVVVAVGGDGTVNRVASVLNHTNIALGILPFGSGNGLARSIGVSMNIEKALQQVCEGETKKIDSGLINGKQFFCTAGAGFDAHIGALFATSTTRGFSSYAKITTRELFSYKPQQYKIAVDEKPATEHTAFLLTAGNASQWGNNIHICPGADICDGILNLTVIKKFPKAMLPGLAFRLFSNRVNYSPYAEVFEGKKFVITRENSGPAHYDGEPEIMDAELKIEIVPASLNVIS